ncbi:hypothetical protein CKALI_03805 [Corynebacterium kalinowskii]|uniref:DUF1963 domain-containing protein n=1 Tax=Corynebacterium kalinowskii TaxID=2675216 RepID=A0A6B8VPA6_9CORY|nr:DUF1963 domain-containing protein [Corynebacterium kalinowskii]QGU01641.1 hypothetical protein CKALI_03805 [Corynebacterium kalinowskii]
MFENESQARSCAADYFPPHAIDHAMAQLIPAIGIRPVTDDRIGGTRIDGAPDVPPHFEWPRADLSKHPKLAPYDLSPEELPEGPSPLWFLAQIDLAEAHRLGRIADQLPETGRLLFFFDHLAGAYLEGPEAVRVVWDQHDTSELAPANVPKELAERADHLTYPAKPSALFAGVTLPQRGSMCPETEPLFEQMDAGEHPLSEFEEEFDQFCEEDGAFVEPEWRHHQILGVPVPCQSDPRGYIDHATPEDWVNLLCYANVEDGEGEVYFLIRKKDLAVRDFSKVSAVYMQT